MVSTVAVVGATGAVGRHVVAELEHRGLKVLPIARSLGVDLASGAGLRDALPGAESLIDVNNIVTTSQRASVAFFSKATAKSRRGLGGTGNRALCPAVDRWDRRGGLR